MSHENKYKIWECTAPGPDGLRHYVCFRLLAIPDEQTSMRLKQNPWFMYGFFDGCACWYGVYSDESAEFMESLLVSAVFTPSRFK